MSRVILLVLMTGLLVGCVAQPSAVPTVTPQVLRVEISSSLDWLRPEMAECVQQSSVLSLSVKTNTLLEQSLNQADVLLHWSDQPVTEGFTFELGEERLAVIVHPDNPLEAMDLSMVKDMYYGQVTVWPGTDAAVGGAIQPWVLPEDSEAQGLFERVAISNSQIIRTAKIAPTPAAMLEMVASDPQAIGFLPSRWLDSSVRSIELSASWVDNLIMPILAVTAAEPTGLTRDWLLCIQERINPQ